MLHMSITQKYLFDAVNKFVLLKNSYITAPAMLFSNYIAFLWEEEKRGKGVLLYFSTKVITLSRSLGNLQFHTIYIICIFYYACK
jgi:hypothetical protein